MVRQNNEAFFKSCIAVKMWKYCPYGDNIKTNRYGFRDTDYKSTTKSDSTFQIAFAGDSGDSVTLRVGVNTEDTFVHQFELSANLMDSRYKVEDLNFAVDGYNASQVVRMIPEKVLMFSAGKVVYMMLLPKVKNRLITTPSIYGIGDIGLLPSSIIRDSPGLTNTRHLRT